MSPRAVNRTRSPPAAARCARSSRRPSRSSALHGHIHESKGVTKIGRTTAINPGSDYPSGHLDGCLIHLQPDRIANHYMVAG